MDIRGVGGVGGVLRNYEHSLRVVVPGQTTSSWVLEDGLVRIVQGHQLRGGSSSRQTKNRLRRKKLEQKNRPFAGKVHQDEGKIAEHSEMVPSLSNDELERNGFLVLRNNSPWTPRLEMRSSLACCSQLG